ncbi:MAG TPA: tetratricopeptide repeat protein, partial [bacterium]|nr:tetratricopeptide repeat protein [bacterium]
YDEAEECYLKALKIDSHNIQALNNLGWLYIKKAEYSKALGVYQIVLEIDQNNAMAYNDIGYLYYKKNMLDKAILELNKAIRLNNDREAMTYAYYHLGLVYLKKKLKN